MSEEGTNLDESLIVEEMQVEEDLSNRKVGFFELVKKTVKNFDVLMYTLLNVSSKLSLSFLFYDVAKKGKKKKRRRENDEDEIIFSVLIY